MLAGEHVWMADTQTPQSHADWLATLAKIESLQPVRVIPGHFAPGAKQDLEATRDASDKVPSSKHDLRSRFDRVSRHARAA